MIKAVAVDMDGTFLKNDKSYEQQRFLAIYQIMKHKKIKFIVASGNQYQRLRQIFSPIADQISFAAENGALVIDRNQEIFAGSFANPILKKTIKLLKSMPQVLHINICGAKSAYICKNDPLKFRKLAQFYYPALQEINSFQELPADNFFKINIHVIDGQGTYFQKLIPEITNGQVAATSGGNDDLDLIVPGLNKATALKKLLAHWKITSNELMAFGDGGNDLEMLQLAGHSYAMANGSHEVLQTAKYLAPTNQQSGVLQVLEQHFAND
ncbi:Cof-type HAD-IIB family hydrolase [Liquorilactobacillus sicerae]|uniref:Cof-type HAD-IIB family hydrolase n=1 Tax=Liquorilactobacillus sicerae TaxID=1416943 RepID=UPI002480A2EC|nr:Cof-type HAD-IIB family hydrolase [Liquorilactobacillus sicerae]